MRTFLTLCFLVLSVSLFAQHKTKKNVKKPVAKHNHLEVGLIGGVMTYTGDVHSTSIFLKQSKPAGGAYFRYYINDHFSTRFNLVRGKIAGSDSLFFDEWRWKRNFNFTSNIWDVNAAIEWEPLAHNRYNMKKKSFQRLLTPYFSLGVGLLHGKPKVNFQESINTAYSNQIAIDKSKNHSTFFSVPFGTGLRYDINKNLSVSAEILFRTPISDYLDGISQAGNPNNKDWYYTAFANLGYRFTYISDKDKDGIADKDDVCLDIAGKKETKGCPDADNDSVADVEDSCPDLAGLATMGGCPDTDKDGIEDKLDVCPNQFGTKETKGCPDRDGDGVVDGRDDCPDQKGTQAFNGCPDSDGDGIADKYDDCPKEAGIKAEKGCPLKDLDKDNVPDRDDLCPDKAGTVANNGCPDEPKVETPKVVEPVAVVKTEEAVVFEEALYGIEFETGSAIITKKSNAILAKVIGIMQRRPEQNYLIEGHTDNSGGAKNNMRLSEARAKAVYNYLVKKGIKANRLEAKGLGDTSPLFGNDTNENKAKNRRVEFRAR